MKTAESANVLSLPHQIESAGVDWMTATAPRGRSIEPLWTHARALVEIEQRNGNECQTWHWQGYDGLKCGGASVGLRGDGVIAQLRSDVARDHWQDIMPHVTNVSRIDLQLTARLDEARAELIRAQYARLRRAKNLRGRPVEATLIDSRSRGSSLYLGRRSSERFARMYDKGGEERSAEPGKLIRWELELKKKAAIEMARGLAGVESVDAVAAATVSEHFRRRRVQCIELASQVVGIPRAPATTNNATKMAYLRNVVAPMLEKLLKTYTLAEVLASLGLDDQPNGENKSHK